MKVFSVLLSLVVVVAADLKSLLVDYHNRADITTLDGITGRITGGARVGASAQPFLVGVLADFGQNRRLTCGASMLSSTRSVTAAHCWKRGRYTAVKFTLAFGADNINSGTRVETTNVEVHPDFDSNSGNNDIAMISHDFVRYTDTIKPISLPYGDLLTDDYVGKWATAVGFGTTADEGAGSRNTDRYKVTLRVINNTICAQTYGASVITNDTLCVSTTGGYSTCDGDSGGPLAYKRKQDYFLIGISSISHVEGCQKGYPAGFTRVTSFISWIVARI